MRYVNSVLELVGRTPMVKLNRLCDPSMATVLVKMEQLNPAGSVKDRMAVYIVQRAIEQGLIKPGGTFVESTSGNTGLGIAMAAAVLGYRSLFSIPDKMSKEKIDMLKAFGAEVLVTRTDLPHDHPESYVEIAKRMAREIPNAYYTDQYHNMDNPRAHYLTTGPEIWEDTDGRIDCLVGGIGTGGTVSGAGRFLKEKAAEAGRVLKIVCPDPVGSIYYDMFHHGRELRRPGIYRVEGIGHDFMVGTLDLSIIDDVMEVTDRESFVTARRLVREEGIFAGGSAGTAVFGALKVARELGPGKLLVVVIPDSGDRYITKCFDDEWMKDMGFLDAEERIGSVRDLVEYKGRHVVFAEREETIAHVAARMRDLGISQMPVRPDGAAPWMMVHELDLLRALAGGECRSEDPALKAAAPLDGIVSLHDSLSKVQRVFEKDEVAVLVESGHITSIIAKIDMVEFLTRRN